MSQTGPTGAGPSGVIRLAFTEQERAEAIEAGAGLIRYSLCRRAGATHTEVLEAHVAGADLGWYSRCREACATHTDALEALGAGADLCWYSYCRRADATHAEAMALRLCKAGRSPFLDAKIAVRALRAACGTGPARELGETIATLAQDWAGTADELAATAVALLSTRAS